MEHQSLIIGALMHDIGKFFQRTGLKHHEKYSVLKKEDYGFNGAHSKWSADFVERYFNEDIADLVLYHHAPENARNKNFAKIIQEADHLSSAVDRVEREDVGEVDKEPLKAIFPRIKLGKNKEIEDSYYRIRKLEISDDVFPGRKVEEYVWKLDPIYKELWNEFVREFERIGNKYSICNLLYILKKYTSYIPSAAYKHEPDIPLFDHLKTTAAIASCLYLSNNDENPFLILQGDLSGIQKFIFDIASPEEARKGMARRLRGRSFWLSLFMDSVVAHFLKETNLFETSVLWCTGGNFLILAPNTEEVKNRIYNLRKTVNQILLERFNGKIFLAMDFVECSKDELKNFPSILERSTYNVNRLKRRKFADCDIIFEAKGSVKSVENFCSVCGAEVDVAGEKCGICELHEELGRSLSRARFMIKGKGSVLRFDFSSFGLDVSYDFVSVLDSTNGDAIFKINDTNFILDTDRDLGFVFMGNTVPVIDRVMSFDEISQISKGAKKIGVLKADVDNLGKIFALGLERKFRSISRIHTLSSHFQYFFGGYLNKICMDFSIYPELCDSCKEDANKIEIKTGDGENKVVFRAQEVCDNCRKNRISEIYVVYSGGDDLLVFGPYDSIIELAGKIQENFRKYTCDNPDVTLSAGITVVDSHLPVARSVQQAIDRLDTSKSYGKNRLTIFDESVLWSDNGYEKGFNTLISSAKELEKMVEEKRVSKSLVYSMLNLWYDSFGDLIGQPIETQISERLRRKRYLPKMMYLLRDIGDRDELAMFFSKIFPWIRLPVYWVSLRCRG